MMTQLSNTTSVLGMELCREISELVKDFRRRKPGVQDWEIQQGLLLARQEIRGRRGATAIAIALSAAALLAGLAIAWMGL